MLIVTAYTDNGGYAELVDAWIDSVRKRLPDSHFLVLRLGEIEKWKTAAHLKPWAILHGLQTGFPRVAWIDIDAEVVRTFEFPDGEWDLAFRQYREHSMTGTLLLKNSPKVRSFVADWARASELSEEVRNQLVFEKTLRDWTSPEAGRHRLEVHLLPPGMTFVSFDDRDAEVPWEERFVIHRLQGKLARRGR